MPQEGWLTLETAMTQFVGSVPGLYIRLTVSDARSRMDAATQSPIFEPSFSLEEPAKAQDSGCS
jgi:hypothetical protein